MTHDLPILIEASARLARVAGQDTPKMREARQHARRALALAIGEPDHLADRLAADMPAHERARANARRAVAAQQIYRPDHATIAMRNATDRLKDAIVRRHIKWDIRAA